MSCASWCRRAGLYRNLGRNDREDDHGEEAEEVEDEGEERQARPPRRARRRKRRRKKAAARSRPPKKKAKKRSAPRKAKPAAAARQPGAGSGTRAGADARDGSAVARHRHRRLEPAVACVATTNRLAALRGGRFLFGRGQARSPALAGRRSHRRRAIASPIAGPNSMTPSGTAGCGPKAFHPRH